MFSTNCKFTNNLVNLCNTHAFFLSLPAFLCLSQGVLPLPVFSPSKP